MKKVSLLVLVLFLLFIVSAQDEVVPSESEAVPESNDEVKKLSEQVNELLKKSEQRDVEINKSKQELELLKNELNALKTKKEELKPAEKAKEPEKKEEKLVKFKPYGFVELYGYGNDAQFMSNDLMIFVKDEKKSTANISARNTRLGLDVSIPYITAVDLFAKIEVDFFGSLPDSGNSEPSTGIRMRHGFLKIAKTFSKKTTISLLAGQTWATAVIPTFPSLISPAAGWGAGNLWNRLPVAELELSQKAGPVILGLKAAVAKPISGTSANRKGFIELNIDAGDASHWPSLQSQIYLNAKFSAIDVFWAAGGAYGRENYTGGIKVNNGDEIFGDEVEVWMFNTALKVTHKYAEIQGKYFMGANMDMFGFFGGSLIKDAEGYVVDSMKAQGYWAELSLKPYRGLKLSVGLSGEYTDHDQAVYDQNDCFWVSAFWTFYEHFTPAFQWQQIITEKDDKKLTGNAFLGSLKFTF